MNRAAEHAVPLAKNLLVDAVRNMSVQDAKNILTGGDTSVTDFFADKTRTPLGATFLPVVQAGDLEGAASPRSTTAWRGKAAGLGPGEAGGRRASTTT